jgi:hypothetical protein
MVERDPNEDWGRVFAEAVAIARTVTQRDAEELVQQAMVLYFSGKAPFDRAGKETLAEHLALVGLKARGNRERIERRRRNPAVVAKIVKLVDTPPPTPEDALSEADEERRKTRLFEQLLVELASDAEAREIALLVQQGVHDAHIQAERSGMKIEVVRNARKRIKRRFEAIVEQDEKEAGTP